MKYSDNWENYRQYIIELQKVPTNSPQYIEIKKKLFETYELYYNMNNTIQPITVRSVLKQWLSTYCQAMLVSEKQNFIDNLKLEKYTLVRDIINYIIEELSNSYCLLSCSSNMNNECFHGLAYEIMKHCNRFICFPQTDANIDIFINSSPMYLEKEISQKDYYNSPIEEIMFEALQPIINKFGFVLQREYTVRDEGRTEIRYALDLAVLKNQELILDIETDGLSYHKDYQSMAADRKRDRWLLMRGVPTIRFTSREVFDDLENTLIQIEEVLKIINDWNK